MKIVIKANKLMLLGHNGDKICVCVAKSSKNWTLEKNKKETKEAGCIKNVFRSKIKNNKRTSEKFVVSFFL
jgi:hypothetical protein